MCESFLNESNMKGRQIDNEQETETGRRVVGQEQWKLQKKGLIG